MKIVLTGSLGNISKPLTEELVKKGHQVTVISSNPEKQTAIEALGATAAIGQVTDPSFLTPVFKGADTAYLMIPPNYAETDQVAYYTKVGNAYASAIQESGLQRAVNLSSYGAHLEKGTGFIVGSYEVEKILSALSDVDITFLRPTYFYYNLNNFIQMIKNAGFIAANYGGSDKLTLVAPADIAAAAAAALTTGSAGHQVRYVASDERTCDEIAGILGAAIGIPGLKWQTFTNEQMLKGLTSHGVPEHVAENLVELGAATHSGILASDYHLHQPVLGNIKLETFAKEFAKAYKQS